MQHILTTHSYLTKGLINLFDFFVSIGKSWQYSRQCAKNEDLIRYFRVEYPHMTDAQILYMLNKRTLEDFK